MPMFDLLSEYVGLHNFTLLCGNPPKDDEGEYSIAVVNYGKTAENCPRNFFQFNPEAFKKQVLGPYMEFLQATKGSVRLLQISGPR